MPAEISDHDRIVEMHTLLKDKLMPMVDDHEDRLRKVELRPSVRPRHVYLAVTLACLLLTAIAGVAGVFLR